MKLGEILIRRNIVNRDQLNQAIQIQQATHQKIGKILLDYCCLDSDILERSLQEQYWRSQHKWVID
ncbi:MAG: hypothetical protein AAGD25_35515 [Cyanobacteria bacterium P01_F01_bin.150]